jgi:hypothetical protein
MNSSGCSGKAAWALAPVIEGLDQRSQPTRTLRSRRRLRSRGMAVAVAALVAVAVAVTLTIALSGGSRAAARTASSAQADFPEIPAGYRVYTDSARHFSAAIPDSWLASTDDGLRTFCAPRGCPEVVLV